MAQSNKKSDSAAWRNWWMAEEQKQQQRRQREQLKEGNTRVMEQTINTKYMRVAHMNSFTHRRCLWSPLCEPVLLSSTVTTNTYGSFMVALRLFTLANKFYPARNILASYDANKSPCPSQACQATHSAQLLFGWKVTKSFYRFLMATPNIIFVWCGFLCCYTMLIQIQHKHHTFPSKSAKMWHN